MAEGKIPTGIIIGAGAAAAAIAGTFIYLATRAWAAPPGEYMCPYCGAGPFPTLEKVNEHITNEHPGERLVVIVEWQ